MAKLPTVVSATIVLIFQTLNVWASPIDEYPKTPIPSEEEVATPAPLSEDMQIAQPRQSDDPLPPPKLEYYPYKQQLTVRYGQTSDLTDIDFDDNLIGFQYLFPKFLSPKLEAGADLHERGKGHIHAGMRWIYSERNYFRPSVKLSGDILLDSKQKMATFTHLVNYYLRGTGTVEYVFSNPYSVRLESEVYLGTENHILAMSLGLSRGW